MNKETAMLSSSEDKKGFLRRASKSLKNWHEATLVKVQQKISLGVDDQFPLTGWPVGAH